MKSRILPFSLLFISLNCYSQYISVELSIKWNKEYISCNIEGLSIQDSLNVPYLVISYRNNSNCNIYFPKVTNSPCFIPPISSTGLDQYKSGKLDLKLNQSIINKVYIGGNRYEISNWEVVDNNVDFYVEHEICQINDKLIEVYESCGLYFCDLNQDSNYLDLKKGLIINQINNSRNRFAFLKVGQVYSDKYNLLAFLLLEGNYEFILQDTIFYDYIYSNPIWDESLKYWKYQKTLLPKIVGIYSLSCDSFLTNSILVKLKK